jgi:glycogen(starch) synthase
LLTALKILFTSYAFSPDLGGLETVSALLAPEFVRAGHEVKLVTKTREEDHRSWPFEVVRDPGVTKLLELTRWCDVFFQNNISLELAWPLLLIHRPWIVAHQVWLNHETGSGTWRPRVKKFLLRFARNTAISHSIAEALPVSSTLVGNPYAPEIFRPRPGIGREHELVYLGRLVSDKGVDVLIGALAELRQRGLSPRLTIIGSGPEMAPLREMAERLQIESQIKFAGSKTGLELAQALNAHQIMVIPSRWAEPFGVVALEGIACGCAIVASRTGGLPEAIGPCGLLVEPGNCIALADALETALTRSQFREQLQREAPTHLARFIPSDIANRYLRLFGHGMGME